MSFLKSLRRRARFAYKVFHHLTFAQAVHFSWNHVRGNKILIQIQINSFSIRIRTATPDLGIAFSSLVDGEYSAIKTNSVKLIVDAGANIGSSSLYFAQRFPGARIIAIEPEAENFQLLCHNVSQWPQIQPIRAALAIKPGKCELMDRGTGPWGYTITQSDQVIGRMNQKVDCLTVQSIIDQFESKEIDILKLDIEGGELDLFLNPDEWIDRVRSIVVELHDRIAPGCSNAFESATRDFPMRFRSGEKQIVYRENWNQ